VEQIITSKDIEINARTAMRYTPLWVACNCGYAEIVEILLKAEIDSKLLDTQKGLIPLHLLAKFDSDDIEDIANQLTRFGADVNILIKTNKSTLDYVYDDERNFSTEADPPAILALLDLNASPYGTLDLSDINR
jgi:ankyrin repeat protein